MQIHIENFRKFKKAIIPITKSHLILGANNSGKTTITKAIDLFFSNEKVDKEDLIDSSNPAKITLNFNNNETLETWIYQSKGTKTTTSIESFPKNLNHDQDYKERHIFIPAEIIEAENIAQKIAIQNNPEIKNEIRKIEEKLSNKIEELLNSKDVSGVMIFDQVSNFSAETSLTPKTNISVKNNLPLSQEGDGYRKNISISLLKKLKLNSSIIIIDEIENHLSIPNVRNIISRIIKNNNVIFTSHRLEAKLNDIIGITFLGETENDIISVIKSLKIVISEYQKIILVEGKTDIYYVNKFIELKREKDRNYNAIVVHVGGEGQMNKIYTKLNEMEINNLYALKDGDQSHKKEENIIYLKRKEIESYRDDWKNLMKKSKKLLSNNASVDSIKNMAKSLGSMRLDFMEKEDNALVQEFEEIFN